MKKALLLLVVLLLTTAGSYYMVRSYWFPLKYEQVIVKYSKQYHVSPSFVAGIIRMESGFDESREGGLMNLSEHTAEKIAREMGMKYFDASLLSHPETNLKLGIWYLGKTYSTSNYVTTIRKWSARNGTFQKEKELNEYVRSAAQHNSYYKLLYGGSLQ